jgi:hypothetical protein
MEGRNSYELFPEEAEKYFQEDQDVIDRERLGEKLYAASIMDELTDLYDGRGFLSLAAQQTKIAERTKQVVALFFRSRSYEAGK